MSTTTLVTDTPPAQEQHHLVKAGDNVIFQNHEGKIYFVQGISSETKQKFYKKAQTSLGTVIGKPYFSFYEVKDKELHGPLNYNPGKDDILDTQDVQTHEQVKGDNRSLVDNNKSQALTSEDIAKLKKENVDAKTIISTLVEGSQTFHTKTQFAQEKYVERKKKKYLNFVKIVPPSVELICDHYFNGDADKVAYVWKLLFTKFLLDTCVLIPCHNWWHWEIFIRAFVPWFLIHALVLLRLQQWNAML